MNNRKQKIIDRINKATKEQLISEIDINEEDYEIVKEIINNKELLNSRKEFTPSVHNIKLKNGKLKIIKRSFAIDEKEL